MRTLFSIGFLVGIGFVANFLWGFVGNLAGLPGAVLGGLSPSRPLWRFRIGILVAFLGQAYVGLAFVAGIVAWTRLAAARPDVLGLLLWPFAFLAVVGPVWATLIQARVEAAEQGRANAQVEALHLTTLVVVLGFLAFAVLPGLAVAGWAWVPFVTSASGG